MIYILLFMNACLIVRLYQVHQEKKIYYSNYKNCLMVLEEYDPKLKEYLERSK